VQTVQEEISTGRALVQIGSTWAFYAEILNEQETQMLDTVQGTRCTDGLSTLKNEVLRVAVELLFMGILPKCFNVRFLSSKYVCREF
jgi:hypothetical protein